ncbi:MAG: extracellular solute-binding protein [Lentisphaerae bacterium]|nr:extracellular solute-binding protein [Lentisphaerota bacterium]
MSGARNRQTVNGVKTMHGRSPVKRRTRLCSLALLLALAAGVGADEIVENAAQTGAKTTLKYALWGGANEVAYSRKICEAFVRKHPEIRLEVSVYPWGQYWAKLQTQAASGLAPDVISLYSGNAALWIARGALLPLDAFVKQTGLNLDDYHRSAIDICSWDGKLYCMPLEIPARTLVFSK